MSEQAKDVVGERQGKDSPLSYRGSPCDCDCDSMTSVLWDGHVWVPAYRPELTRIIHHPRPTSFLSTTTTTANRHGKRSRRLDCAAQPVQTALRGRCKETLRQGARSLLMFDKTRRHRCGTASPASVRCVVVCRLADHVLCARHPGAGDPHGGVKCPTCEMSGDRLR